MLYNTNLYHLSSGTLQHHPGTVQYHTFPPLVVVQYKFVPPLFRYITTLPRYSPVPHLAAISGGIASGGELDPTARLGLHLELHQAEVVACKEGSSAGLESRELTLAKDIPGLLADVSVAWRSHRHVAGG